MTVVLGNNVTGEAFTFGAAGRKYATKAVLATAGTLTELHAIVSGGNLATDHIILAVYADSSGSPGALVALAYTTPILVPNAQSTISQTGFTVTLAAGTYWLTWLTDTNNSVKVLETDLDGTAVFKGISTGAYASPPSDPFGSTTTSGARKYNVWAVVDVATTTTADVPFISASTTFYTPGYSLLNTETVPFIAAGTTLYTPSGLSEHLDVPFITSSTTAYTPSYTLNLNDSVPFVAAATSVYTPVLSNSGIDRIGGQSGAISV